MEKTQKLFPVSFTYILLKINSSLRQLQTSRTKSIVRYEKLHIYCTLSKITGPKKLAIDIFHYNSEFEKTKKTLPSFFQMHVMKN